MDPLTEIGIAASLVVVCHAVFRLRLRHVKKSRLPAKVRMKSIDVGPDGFATVHWDTPERQSADVNFFSIRVDVEGKPSFDFLVLDPKQTAFRFPVDPCCSYKVTMTASNARGTSHPSVLTFCTPACRPGRPRGIVAEPLPEQSDSIKIWWGSPAPRNGEPLPLSYTIRVRKLTAVGENQNRKMNSPPPPTRFITIGTTRSSDLCFVLGELEPETTYCVSVAATNSQGPGPYGDILYFKTNSLLEESELFGKSDPNESVRSFDLGNSAHFEYGGGGAGSSSALQNRSLYSDDYNYYPRGGDQTPDTLRGVNLKTPNFFSDNIDAQTVNGGVGGGAEDTGDYLSFSNFPDGSNLLGEDDAALVSSTYSEFHKSLDEMGAALLELHEFDQALSYFDQSLQLSRESGGGNNKRHLSVCLANLGMCYLNVGQCEKALECYEECLQIRKERADARGVAEALLGIGQSKFALGQEHQSISHIQLSLALSKREGDSKAMGLALGALAAIFQATGDFPRALECHRSHLKLRETVLFDRPGEASSLFGIAECSLRMGSVSDALEAAQKARELFAQLDNVAQEIEVLGLLITLHKETGGSPAQLVECSERGFSLCQRMPELDPLSICFFTDAWASGLMATNEHSKAVEKFDESLKLYSSLEDFASQSNCLRNMSVCWESLGDYDRALHCHQEYLRIQRNLRNAPQ